MSRAAAAASEKLAPPASLANGRAVWIEADGRPESTLVDAWEGWGTSLCWWAAWAGKISNTLYFESLMDHLFTYDKGLGLNIVRYNIYGGSDPGDKGLFRDYAGEDGFWPGPDAPFDWSRDAPQRRVLFAALARGVTTVEAFSNSPPAWMTVSGKAVGGLSGTADNLRSDMVPRFAHYLCRVLAYYETQGVTFASLSPFNEPLATWWCYEANKQGFQEGCHHSVATQVAVLDAVREQLRLQKLAEPRLVASEDWSPGWTRDTLQAGGDQLWSRVDQVNTHGYGAMNRKDRAELGDLCRRHRVPLWLSEVGFPHAGLEGLIELAEHIILDITAMRCSAWIYWQALEQWGDWGMIHQSLREDDPQTIALTSKYHGMKHFTHHIRPGARLLQPHFPHGSAPVGLLMARGPPQLGTRRAPSVAPSGASDPPTSTKQQPLVVVVCHPDLAVPRDVYLRVHERLLPHGLQTVADVYRSDAGGLYTALSARVAPQAWRIVPPGEAAVLAAQAARLRGHRPWWRRAACAVWHALAACFMPRAVTASAEKPGLAPDAPTLLLQLRVEPQSLTTFTFY
ncbi:hypothetical protein CXG81DRAFT_19974 [Caulochytrium protostelioides]|uniref:Endo-beta-1,6-galactanase-like domain-containing protein n=1 Tax=Caulochytrium protostelioides TaxID=1555241 RepID=A0A4P9X4L7_9FUNG|nr:hypothetical protein CXG81DRAFT_19974 [Caulochytrium protostelioides]|eukprot:RKP00010.1 hypothetical protein CXG81DRAFT_19974 [Caulochytrium protostelioides]